MIREDPHDGILLSGGESFVCGQEHLLLYLEVPAPVPSPVFEELLSASFHVGLLNAPEPLGDDQRLVVVARELTHCLGAFHMGTDARLGRALSRE
jgi:hypothetical protein